LHRLVKRPGTKFLIRPTAKLRLKVLKMMGVVKHLPGWN
jgi:hypothetical protein